MSFQVRDSVVTPNAVTAALNQGNVQGTTSVVPMVYASNAVPSMTGTVYVPVCSTGTTQVFIPRGFIASSLTGNVNSATDLHLFTSQTTTTSSTGALASTPVSVSFTGTASANFVGMAVQGVNPTAGYLYCQITSDTYNLNNVQIVTSVVPF